MNNTDMKTTFIASLLSFSLMASAQTSPFNPGITADGVNYALPRTGLRADVAVYKVTYTPGEFARYADRYMHLSGISTNPETTHHIASVNIYQYGQPDTLKYYTIKYKDKSVMPLAQLTPDGILVAINTGLPESGIQGMNQQNIYPRLSTNHKLDSRRYFTTEILSAASASKMAELVAQEIMEIRESKNALRRGQVESMPKDGESLKILFDELDAQESALTQLFTGYTDTISTSESYSIMPEGDIDKAVFFRFSSKLGLLDDDDPAGMPYYISIHDMHTVTIPTEAEFMKRKINGVVYNMPSMADVKIFNTQSVIYDNDLPFAQFGTCDVLASSLFGKDATTMVTFNAATGALIQVSK